MANVLIVDDDEDDRDLFCIAVHELEPKINCILARNGEEALQGLQLEKFPKPDVIFLDLNMPRLNGIQFLRELKKDSQLQTNTHCDLYGIPTGKGFGRSKRTRCRTLLRKTQ